LTRRKVLLIGWDAADWKVIHPLMAAGRMPNVARLAREGAAGHVATLHPPLSPMLWTSIATGKRPFKHGIHGFFEPTSDARDVRPVSNRSRTTKAVWNILSQSGLRSIVLGWWPSHPAEPIDGVMVSDHFHRADGPVDEGWPLVPGSVHPPELGWTLAGLRLHPDLLTPEMVEPFVPLAREIDQDKDLRPGTLMRTLAECISMQSVALWLLEHEPWDFFAVYFDSIDHFSHGFMRYHPPRQPWIPERDFELYREVVSMAYQFHDRVLGALLEKAGQGATVILMADHGFHPDHLRPMSIPAVPAGPAVEHRDLGILALAGPAIKPGEKLRGASILDILPTILTMYGLPVGEDMDGKVLTRAFTDPPAPAFIPSWDHVPGADGRHPPGMQYDPAGAHDLLEQMVALGYVEPPDEDRDTAVRKAIRELRFNLAESYQHAARHREACEILTALRAEDPSDRRFALRLFASCQALKLREEMRRIAAELPGIDFLEAQLLIEESRYRDAGALVDGRSLAAADLCLRQRRWREAKRICQAVLALDPDNARAHAMLARVALARGEYEAAVRSALEAVERAHHDPEPHYLLARALAGLKEYARAAEALRAAISFNPHFPEAHWLLARLLRKHLGDPASARAHRALARQMAAV